MLIKNSFLRKNWKLADFDERYSLMLSQRFQLDEIISKIISIKKINFDDIFLYLKPSLKDQIPEPYLFKNMKKSINRVYKAIENNEKIAIIADYDVDGATSAALLIKFFQLINIEVDLEIPNRITEGYGPNKRIINNLKKNNIKLAISVDCGTTSFDIFNKKILNKIDIIVIDHHVGEINIPDVHGLINPNQLNEDNNQKYLAAVGVTFLFLVALRRKLNNNNYYKLNNFEKHNLTLLLDLVALGTVCDVVPLIDLNRAFVKKGLEIIRQRNNLGISSILDNANVRNQPNVFDLSYIIGPRLNAASRIGDSKLATKILCSNDLIEIENISRKLNLLNEKRKLIEDKIVTEAREQADLKINKKILIVESFYWNRGVIGIVASRLVEEYNKPTIVLSKGEFESVGSARSIPDIDLGLLIISAKQEGIIINGGGHKIAAGLKISNDKIEDLSDYLENKCIEIKNDQYNLSKTCDYNISLEQIDENFLEKLEILEPFGIGNKEPIFIIKHLKLDFIKIINNKHLSLLLVNNIGNSINAICFNSVNSSLGANLLKSKNKRIDVVANIKRNYFSKKNSVQLIIMDAAYSN